MPRESAVPAPCEHRVSAIRAPSDLSAAGAEPDETHNVRSRTRQGMAAGRGDKMSLHPSWVFSQCSRSVYRVAMLMDGGSAQRWT